MDGTPCCSASQFTDTACLIFMIIGIVGYFTVPSVANYIIRAGGSNALLQKVTIDYFDSEVFLF